MAGKGKPLFDHNAILAGLVLGCGALMLFFSSPHHGEFWWSDAPRHALNGVFVRDLIVALPQDPRAWAIQYYLHTPALTILFYPPLFYIISAPFYAVFGVSHATAMGVETLHFYAFSLGLFFLTRRWVGPTLAILIGLSAMAAPGLALWGRQVMLEVPSLCFLVWSAVVLCAHLRDKRTSLLILSVVLFLAAAYTKINAVFVLPAMAAALVVEYKSNLFRNRAIWFAIVLTILGLIPLAVLTIKFGSANVQSVVGISDSRVSRASIEGWIFYARQVPALIGLPLAILSALGLILTPLVVRRLPIRMSEMALLIGWLVSGYLFLSLVDLKEARHGLLLTPPLLVLAGSAVLVAIQNKPVAIATSALAAFGTGIFTLLAVPVPAVDGYREAAEWVAKNVPENAIVLFSGKRDGSFIFSLRSFEARRDIAVLRGDKLLLTLAVRRTLGFSERPLSEPEISRMIDFDGVRYVVAQSNFWTDIAVMDRLQKVLRSSHFQVVARIQVSSNVPSEDHELVIYKNLGNVNPHPPAIDLPMAIIGSKISGKVGH